MIIVNGNFRLCKFVRMNVSCVRGKNDFWLDGMVAMNKRFAYNICTSRFS